MAKKGNKPDVYTQLNDRGMIAQCTYEAADLQELLNTQKVAFYIGFDPTADSLHVGHLLALRAAMLMQRAGHKPILIVGGGTALVGDPSGRSSMRPLLDPAAINANVAKIRKQMARFLRFDGANAAQIVNNADWLTELKWVETLRTVGVQMSVNKMLATDAYKARWDRGLSFLELSYMVMQAYDFWHLFKTHNVRLQIGGSDQWANVLAGADLIRRKEGQAAFGLTLTLLTKADGTKMGKTAAGALWLDPQKVSPYDFYQYWINVDDADVKKLLFLLTDLAASEIAALTNVSGRDMRNAKRVLAQGITKAVHGMEAAAQAEQQTAAAFGGDGEQAMPKCTVHLPDESVVSVLVATKLAPSKAAARRLITGGGVVIDGQKVSNPEAMIPAECIKAGTFTLFKGKKQRLRIKLLK